MASKRRLRRNACAGKVAYSTKQAARSAVFGLKRKDNDWMNAYHCTFGDHWHVGHATNGARRSAAALARNRRAAL